MGANLTKTGYSIMNKFDENEFLFLIHASTLLQCLTKLPTQPPWKPRTSSWKVKLKYKYSSTTCMISYLIYLVIKHTFSEIPQSYFNRVHNISQRVSICTNWWLAIDNDVLTVDIYLCIITLPTHVMPLSSVSISLQSKHYLNWFTSDGLYSL